MSEAAKAEILRIVEGILKFAKRDQLNRVLLACGVVLVVLGFLNLILFLAGTFYFGGDAINGRTEGGRYFLWGYHNGTKDYIEVSRTVFEYSKWQAYSVVVSSTLMILAAMALSRIGRTS